MAQPVTTPESAAVSGVHHVGVTVASRERTLESWESVLGKPARWTKVVDGSYLSRVVGFQLGSPGPRLA